MTFTKRELEGLAKLHSRMDQCPTCGRFFTKFALKQSKCILIGYEINSSMARCIYCKKENHELHKKRT